MLTPNISGRGRWMRAWGYALIAAGGAVTFWQVTGWEGLPVSRPLWWTMSAWLTLGGTFSLVGSLSRRWTGEFVGLPLIGSAFLGFTFLQINLNGLVAQLGSHFLLTGFALIILSRWRDVWALYRAAVQVSSEGEHQ